MKTYSFAGKTLKSQLIRKVVGLNFERHEAAIERYFKRKRNQTEAAIVRQYIFISLM